MRHLLPIAALLLFATAAFAHPDTHEDIGPHVHVDVPLPTALAQKMASRCVEHANTLPVVDAPWDAGSLNDEQRTRCAVWYVKGGLFWRSREMAKAEAKSVYDATVEGDSDFINSTYPDHTIIHPAVCGDGFVTSHPPANEECDDGDMNSNTEPDACRVTCLNAYCGDGVVDTGETCDPGVDDTCNGSCDGFLP
jgi:hypothetical protein